MLNKYHNLMAQKETESYQKMLFLEQNSLNLMRDNLKLEDEIASLRQDLEKLREVAEAMGKAVKFAKKELDNQGLGHEIIDTALQRWKEYQKL